MNRLPCQQADPDLFFAEPGSAEAESAKRLCAGCPIRARCAEGAVARAEPYGVFGGFDETERFGGSIWAVPVGGMSPERLAIVADRRARVVEMADRLTPPQIATALGVATSVVVNDLSRMRRTATVDRYPAIADRVAAATRGEEVTLTLSERMQVVDMLDDGTRSQREIARLGRVSPGTVRARRRTAVAA